MTTTSLLIMGLRLEDILHRQATGEAIFGQALANVIALLRFAMTPHQNSIIRGMKDRRIKISLHTVPTMDPRKAIRHSMQKEAVMTLVKVTDASMTIVGVTITVLATMDHTDVIAVEMFGEDLDPQSEIHGLDSSVLEPRP